MQKVDQTVRRHRFYDCSNIAALNDSFSDASAIEVAVLHLSRKYKLGLREAFVLVTQGLDAVTIRCAAVLADEAANLTCQHRGLRHVTVSKSIRYAVLNDDSSLTIQLNPDDGAWLVVQAQMPLNMVGMTYKTGQSLQDQVDALAIRHDLAIRSQAEAFLIAAERTRLSPIAAAMFFFKIDHFPSADYIISDRDGGGRALTEVRMPDGTSLHFGADEMPEILGVSEKHLRLNGQLVSRHTLESRLDRAMKEPHVQMIYGSVLRIMAEQRKKQLAKSDMDGLAGELVAQVEAVAI